MSDREVTTTGMSSTKAYFYLSGTIAITAAAVTLALAYSLVVFWIFAGVGALFALRYLLLALKVLAEIVDSGAETYIKISTHRASLRELKNYTRIEPDELGNYAALVNRNGQVITYLQPGNSPVAPRKVEVYDTTAEEIEDVEDAPLQLESPGINPATIAAMSLAEELRGGLIRPGQPAAYGWKIAIDPFSGRASLEAINSLHDYTAFMVGWSGVGKSRLVAASMARRVVASYGRVAFLVVDPHKANPERSLSAIIRPALDPWIFQPKGGAPVAGNNPKDLRAIVDFLKFEINLRLERDDLTEEQKRRMSPVALLPIWFVVDEALAMARQARVPGHDKVYEEFTAILQSVATETAKAGITGVYMSQLGAKAQLGAMEIRDVCPYQIVLKTPKDQAETLGLTASDARIAKDFPKGRGFISDGGEPETFVWGFAEAEDIAQAVEGLSSPLVPAWKQEKTDRGNRAGNKVVNLFPCGNQDTDFSPETTRELDSGNRYPEALQAALEDIPNWEEKLDILRPMIGGDLAEIWVALFGKRPGGRNHDALRQEYDVLAEAVRYEYQQLRQERQAQ